MNEVDAVFLLFALLMSDLLLNSAGPQLGLAAGCHQLNFTIFDWNKSAQDFYLRQGCIDITASTGKHFMRCEGEALERLARPWPNAVGDDAVTFMVFCFVPNYVLLVRTAKYINISQRV